MPGRITFDEALASNQAETSTAVVPKRITFDEAIAVNEATARAPARNPSGTPVVGKGEELRPGVFNPDGSFTPPQVLKAPLPADESRFGLALKSEIPADEGTRLRVLSESLFPGDPDGINRVGIRNGAPVYVNDEGQLQYVSGGFSRIGAKVAASTPEIAGSLIGSFVGGPSAPVAGPAIGGAVGKAAKRGLSALLLDEPVTPGGVAKEVAIEGGINAVAGKLGALGTNAFNRGKFIEPGSFDARTLREAEQLIRRVRDTTGIELDLAQATGNRYLLELRDYASKYPGKTSDIFQIRDAANAGQFDVVTNKVLDLVSQPIPAGIAGANAVNAAQGVIRGARREVSDAVRPLYERAYASVPEITEPQLLNYLKLPYFDQAFKSGQKIAKLEGVALQEGQRPDLRSFDYLKQGLDDVIQKLTDKGARKEAAALIQRKNEFVEQLDQLSGDAYNIARQAYGDGIKAKVAPLENGLVGVLAKMAPQNAEKAARIFTDPSLAPESIALLKSSLSRLDPEAYNGLVRQYLAREFDSAVTTTQGSEVINPAGKVYQRLFGSPDRQKKLKALLPPDSYDLAQELFVVAEKLAKTPLGANRIAGSQTASKVAISEQLGSRVGPVLSLFTFSREGVKDAAQLEAREKGVQMIADALTNPAKRKLLKQAVRIKDSTRQRIVLGSIFSGQTGDELVRDLGENAGVGQ